MNRKSHPWAYSALKKKVDILKCIYDNKKHILFLSMLKTIMLIFFWWIKSSKEQHLFEIVNIFLTL